PPAARALATFYNTNGRLREAEPYLKAYAATSTDAKMVLADFYLREGRTKDAVAVLEPLSNEGDAFVPAKLRLAAVDFQANKRPQAYQMIEEILKREPGNEQTLEMKARFLMTDQRFAEAIQITEGVIKGNPDALRSHYLR